MRTIHLNLRNFIRARLGFAIGVFFVLAGCTDAPVTLTFSGETMGTTYNVTAIDASGELDRAEVHGAIETALAEVNASMNNWDPTSEISRFNAAQTTQPVEISPELAYVMANANAVHTASQGQFDATLGPVIELWGFGARNSQSPVPDDAAILAALARVGQSKVLTLGEDTMQKAFADTSVFLAAIAKGYGVDRIASALEEYGLEDYLVEIGGDLLAKGNNSDGQPWRIGIERPTEGVREIEEVLSVSGYGMATSGDYRNYFEEDGVRYSHIIDPVVGRPISHTTASVTVLAENAMLADAWATALLALGHERGVQISQEQGLAALFIYRQTTSGDVKFSNIANANFEKLRQVDD